jgi:CRP/FNR family transcriptional regulator
MIRNNFQSPNRANFGRCAACGLRRLSICDALDDADLSEFERMARHVHLAPNDALFAAGEVAGAVHTMISGVARLYKLMPDGRRQVLGFALPGDFLGISPSDRYSFSAEAVDTVSACRFPVEGIHALH